MDIHLAGILSVLILLLIETRLSAKWSPFYFKNGLPLFSRNCTTDITSTTSTTSTTDNQGEDIEHLSSLLNNTFNGTGFSQSIHFKPIDRNTLAFREKLFEFTLFSYTPLMHGMLENKNNRIRIVGYMNWYPLGFLVLWYTFLTPHLKLNLDIIFLTAPLIIFGVAYIIQSRKYNKILDKSCEG